VLPNIISKPLRLKAPVSEMEAQMVEIERTLRGGAGGQARP
jgi:hypothetical protein